MAADDAFASYPASTQYSIALNGLIGILRASGIEPAETLTKNFSYDAMIKRQCFLIDTDEPEDNAFKHIIIVPRILNLSSLWYTGHKTKT